MEALGRNARRDDRDKLTTWQTPQAQYDAVCAWGIPDHALLQPISSIEIPVFVANGDSDAMILPRYSNLLAGLRLKIYPGNGARFLFQHHTEFAAFLAPDMSASGAELEIRPIEPADKGRSARRPRFPCC